MDIKNRFTGEVIFSVDSDLRGADLRNANLNGANLSGARLWGCRGNNSEIKTMHITKYDVAWTADILQIGCERHEKSMWLKFSDDEISAMDHGALEWWKEWKPKLIAIGVFEEE